MDKFKNEVSFPRSGMSKGTDPRNLKENEYTYALNTNLSSVDGDFIDLSFEKSNILAVEFPQGYKVIGKFNRLLNNRTYYFLHNPSTNNNKFGFVDNNFVFNDKEDIITDDGSILPDPLEDTTQTAYKTFITLLDDSCTTEGFNFRLDKPIKNPLLKEQKTGGVVYFTDGLNPSRFIELDNIQTYFTQEEPCSTDAIVKCPLFYKMLIHQQYMLPIIKSSVVANGGSLNKGSYSFLVALSDALGNEISEYFSLTQPTDVWEIGEGEQSSKAIRLEVDNLDSNYTHYKIIAIFTEKESRTTTLYDVGVFSTNRKEVIISDLSYAQRTSIEKISFNNQRVLTSEGLTTANNSLMEYGLQFEEELNLQPVINLLGSYLEWQTHVAQENLYEYGDMRSKYLGISRNEVVPYGIRFLKKGGSVTPIYPLVGREATASDKQTVSPSDYNRKSFEDTDTCSDTIRNQKWQYFNTAEVIETFSGSGETEVETESTRECYVANAKQLQGGVIDIDIDSSYESLEEYVEDNLCNPQLDALGICDALNDTYPSLECLYIPSPYEDCTKGETFSREADIYSVENESIYFEYEENVGSYSLKDNLFTAYDPFLRSGNGYVQNTEIPSLTLYERKDNLSGNNTMLSAIDATASNSMYQSNFKIFDCSNRDSLTSTSLVSPNNLNSGRFNQKINDKSQWFYADVSEIGKFITITKTVMASIDTEFPTENFEFSSTQRVSFFVEGNNVAIHSILINMDNNNGILMSKKGKSLTIKTQSNSTTIQNIDSTKIYFVVEQGVSPINETKCIKHATKGGYQVYAEDLVITGKKISYDSITIGVHIKYKVYCKTTEPRVGNCQATPYQRGKFAYWESSIDYPDNSELYDSTQLKINPTLIPSSLRQDFINKFTQGSNTDGTLKVKKSFNLTCKPIRHFKFPDNNVSPFMTSTKISAFGDSYIYPLGVTINELAINALLDIALDNQLMSKEDRDSIYGYEIFRGNLATNRSVVASGLLYDFRTYNEEGKTVLYSNYPYNSFGRDYLNQIDASNGLGQEGTKFTFHSPETDYTTNTQASEMKIEGYQFGYSKGNFDEVEEHPKWVILTEKADNLASTLATLEVATEIAIEAAHASSNAQVWVVGGLGSTGTSLGLPAFIAAGVITALGVAAGVLYRYAKYKQEWLTIIENLGVTHNFGYYYYSTGHYNYLRSLENPQNSIRSLQSYKPIKDGRLNITNRVTKEKYDINHIDREWTTFLAIGEDTPIGYANEYSDYDLESITYQGKLNIQSSGRSKEITSKIASSYVHLIDYNPSLHGDINSISWLTTSHKGDLIDPTSSGLGIFGGDTFISRHTLKRKLPLFLTTAMGQSSSTAFEYKRYNNIGTNPLFYINYKVESEYTRQGKSLPVIKSEFNLDNATGKKFYYVAPSKMYLYYYGIPSFLTETRINTNYRESGRTSEQNFYPNVGDVGRWTQETNVKLREPNYFKYSFTYSNQPLAFNYRVLPASYKKKHQSIVENSFNGVIFSLPDYNENGQTDPWLKFKPLDFYEFDTKYGRLKELKGIENESVLGRFEHTAIVFNKVSSTVDDGQSPSTFLGGKDIFQRRTVSFVNSELGFGGTQHSESLSCEFGHFYADNDRGQLIQIPSGGGNMIEISSLNSSGKPTNMKDWFKRHLPYKLFNSNIQGIEKLSKDNAYNYVGTTFGYDPLHKRILITKKDYVPVADCPVYYSETEGFYTDNCQPPVVKCPDGFELSTEVISCGSRLALLIDNSSTGTLGYSKSYFIDLLTYVKGKVKVSFYNTYGNDIIIVENLDLPQALTFINSFTGVVATENSIPNAICRAGTWLNIDQTKRRVIHGFYLNGQIPTVDTFNCQSFASTGLLDIANSIKSEDIYIAGAGDNSLLDLNGYFSEGLWDVGLSFSQKMKNFYDSIYCDDEDYTVEICKKVTASPMCPTGYIYDSSSYTCIPVNPNPQKEFYNSLDVVYYLSYYPVKAEFDRRKQAIIASVNSLASNPNYSNNRYALVIDSYKKDSTTKYKNLVPFTTNKQDIINGLNGTIHSWEYFQVYYSPDDLVMESIAMNYRERSVQDNSFDNTTNSLGEFRTESGVGKVVYQVGVYFEGSGLKMEYDAQGKPTYLFLSNGESKEHYDYLLANRVLFKNQNIQVFTFNNLDVTEIQPSPANNYHKSSTYTLKNVVATTPCFHYYYSNESQNFAVQIVQSIINIGYKDCGGVPIDPICNCSVENDLCVCIEYAEPFIEETKEFISIDDPRYFKEVSWTIGYYPEFGQFSSFYDYLPNYYVNHFRTFESGRNDLGSLWSHNSTNKSYGVFYGLKYPMEVELVVKSQLGSYIGSIGLLTESKRYFNNEDFYLNASLTFNKSIIYNRKECSGLLHLDYIEGHTRYLSRYPITVSEMEQRIYLTKTENLYNYNYFYNRVVKTNNKPFIKNDLNELKIGLDNISFNQTRQLGRLNGDYFLNRLTYDKDSRFCLTIKLQKSLTNLDNM